MTRSYRIRGIEQATASQPATGESAVITSARRVVPGSAREAGVGEIEAHGDEVVKVELENGFVLWTRADDLIRERGRRSVRRDGGDAWEIELKPPARGAASARGQRGWLGLGIKVLEFFGVDLKAKVAEGIGEAFEKKMLKGRAPGLYRLSLGDTMELAPTAENQRLPAADKPLLVFLHGTASSCEGSFGKLWSGAAGAAARCALADKYGDRMFAWEHRSLTQSPIGNALELVQLLPKGVEIHMVSHSRGGLVGELLCLAQRDRGNDPLRPELLQKLFAADRTIAQQLDLAPLDAGAEKDRNEAYEADREALAQLVTELDDRKLKVGRFVRVACPARGTTLASGRLDRWLSVLDYLTGNGLIADVADFMLAVVKERTDPRTLPGLEAMMPGSALTRLLQHPALVTSADLSVIAGDIEGDGLWSQIKLLATDWFYGADHDLVVNTGSMYGGLRRPDKGARFLFDKGANVSHFNYFANDKSVRWLAAGLTRPDGGDGGFQPMQEAKQEEPRWREAVRRSRAAATPRPLAVVLPGTMGSALNVQGKGVWLHYWNLMWGGLEKIHMGAADVEPVDLLDDFYGPLLEFLARSHRVEIFPYDWRLSVRDAAGKLADKLEILLPEAERTKQPVHIVAHSMGGLVTRAMIADGGKGAALWRRVQALPNSRFMMLGTPNLGSYEAVRWLTGYNATQAKLSLLDVTQGTDEIIDLVRGFPGLLELLPFDDSGLKFAQRKLWQDLKNALAGRWQAADEEALRQARDTWTLLKQAPADPRCMVYVAGCQDATVIDYQLADYENSIVTGRKRLEFLGTRRGDGTVSWSSGFLPGVPVWYVENTAHDALCSQKRALPGYLDLLMTGKTTLLPAAPPAGARAATVEAERFVMPALPPTDGIPDQRGLRGMGLGPSPAAEEDFDRPAIPVVQVRVVHGDLAYAKYPVMVGHYLGDVIVNAEAALDNRLKHALSKRLELGLYPGQPGSHAVFINENPDGKPSGAIVIGLGQVGDLSTTVLQTTVCSALLHYALQVAQWPDERFGKNGGVRSAAVSCLLVGSGQGGTSVRDSMEALLRGAVTANERLAKAELNDKVLIDTIEFLDVYQDAALAAAKALKELLADGQLANSVAWNSGVVDDGQGGWRRVRYDDAPGWWNRLEIIEEKGGGGLRFIASTNRARAEITHATGQLRLAERFIRQASRSPATNSEVAKTLFEMLLPNRLKELAPEQTDMILLVDDVSARYPWELIEDRWSQSGRPPAVVAGLVRQLKTPRFRPNPVHGTAPTAYVVGNPNLDGWRDFPDLPGARDEAQKVADLLGRRGFRVRDCIDGNSDDIVDGLHRDAWRILHLAGHGEHEFVLKEDADSGQGDGEQPAQGQPANQKPPVRVSGMVIGKKTFLTPGDVEQMRWVPELVFINCCHLGKTQAEGHGRYSALAANLGVQFINMGVKAVVAAGWAVDDGAASAFAESFYSHMLAGETFGRAVRAAREDTWVRFPDVNTWGAYQCYGDPAYRMHGDGSSRPWQPSYQAPAELVAYLDNHREWVRMQIKEKADDEEKLARMRGTITDLLAGVPEAQREAWFARADVAAAAGFAWGETGAYAEGSEWLERALHAGSGDCPVRAVEQCANFKVRLSGQRWQEMRVGKGGAAESDRRSLIDDIEQAIRELDLICQRAPTVERLNLLGSACKRLAWVCDDEAPRLEALVNMANYYHQAFDLEKKENPYPFSNWAVATAFVAALDRTRSDDWRRILDEQCRHMAAVAKARSEANPNFWDAVGEADCQLVLMMLQTSKSAKQSADGIVALYRAAAQRGASPREYASVVEHLDFVAELADSLSLPAAATAKTIRAAL